ncbi:MAG: cell division protein ZapA [Hyphomonadaceae bacterium]
MQAKLDTLNRAFTIECAACDERRLEDLARALDQRLAGFSGDTDAMRRLVLVSLSLLDEAQATSAALARARTEIERLTDMVVEAKLEATAAADIGDRGRVQALRATHGLT